MLTTLNIIFFFFFFVVLLVVVYFQITRIGKDHLLFFDGEDVYLDKRKKRKFGTIIERDTYFILKIEDDEFEIDKKLVFTSKGKEIFGRYSLKKEGEVGVLSI